MINQETINFLKELTLNNNRDWFQEHKSWYETAKNEFKSFVQQVKSELSEMDKIEKAKVYRIYRDLRFTKDKTPYKTHFSAQFMRKGKHRRGGFYMQISEAEVLVAGGFWGPDKNDLQYIREGILADAEPLREAFKNKEIRNRFGGLTGEELKTAPRGYDREHPDIDLLRKKQFLLMRKYQVDKVFEKNFHSQVATDFATMIPVFQVLTDYLVYDGNGVDRSN